MNAHFSIEYKTQWGEELRILIAGKEHPLSTFDGVQWETDLSFDDSALTDGRLTYHYALYREGKLVWEEWQLAPHFLQVKTSQRRRTMKDSDQAFIISDAWRPIPDNLPLFTSAYTRCVASHGEPTTQGLTAFSQTLQLRVVEPRLAADERLAICGNASALGNWKEPVPLQLIGLQEWAINIDADKIFREIEYKYVILGSDGSIKQWEEGMNRVISNLPLRPGQTWVKTDSQPRFSIHRWKCAGVVIPVFSIRTENSYGVGDFGDLQAMISWAAQVGMRAVQILPINDTMMTGSWQDSYPYNAISIYAFHPLYADLSQLPKLNDKLLMEKFLIARQELNALPQVDYEQVMRLKMDYLRAVYEQDYRRTCATAQYKAFVEDNAHWLVPYAAFSYLRDQYGTPDFSQWPKYSKYNAANVARLTAAKHHQIALYYYIQYQLHRQLTAVHETALRERVIIKGDIPIGISRHSVEAWAEPHYFNLDSQAGAPPDDFSAFGQNWGFPTYNWQAMLADGCSWWLRRFRHMARYFDAYRIDHVLGFFRIWEIPLHSVQGLLGQFSPALPMSQQEIESYGLAFDRRMMTEPYINDDILYELFSYRAELVKTLYLEVDTEKTAWADQVNEFGSVNTFYRLRSEYATQRQIEPLFAGKTDPEDLVLRDGLYALCNSVLFVLDNSNPQAYHPRIAAQKDPFFKALPEHQQQAFNRLYDHYFYRRHNHFWYDEAMRKLPLLTQATSMLTCAEDLGMVPDCVPWVMEHLRMLSLEIQTMPKQVGVEFGQLSDNPWRSVATISTHDMPTLRQWWEEDPQRSQRYYNQALHIDGPAPAQLPAWLAAEIVNRHLYSPSMLCLLSLQDWLSIDAELRNPDAQAERINIPANPRHYWRWRMHISLEQLAANQGFTQTLKTMIGRSGRDQ